MSPKIQFWQWPNVLSIDAVLIAVLWQMVLAQSLGVVLNSTASIVLGLSVWLTYVADRLFDVRNRALGELLSARHTFAKKYARPLWLFWFCVLMVNLSIALSSLSWDQLKSGSALLFACLLYTVLNQKLSHRFFPKEFCVALIYAGGVVIFLEGPTPKGFIVLFTLLCLLNCLMIGAKEMLIDAKLSIHSLAPFILESRLGLYALCLHLFAILAAPQLRIELSLSFLGLGILHLLRKRFSVENYRIAVDGLLMVAPMVTLIVS